MALKRLSSAMAFVEVGRGRHRAADCDRAARPPTRTALRHHLIERHVVPRSSAWSGTRFMRRPSGWSTRSRRPLKPKLKDKNVGGAPVRTATRCAESPAQRPSSAARPNCRCCRGPALHGHQPARARPQTPAFFAHQQRPLRPGQVCGVVSQNYDKTVSIELPAGISILWHPRRRRSGCDGTGR